MPSADFSDRRDNAVIDGNVCRAGRGAGAVDEGAAANYEIMHGVPPSNCEHYSQKGLRDQ